MNRSLLLEIQDAKGWRGSGGRNRETLDTDAGLKL